MRPRHCEEDGENRSGPIRSVRGNDRATHGFDEAARDGKAKTGAGANLIALLSAVKFVEDVLELLGRNTAAFICDLQLHLAVLLPALNHDDAARGCIFRGIIE